jgi:hypothetical protein
VGHIFTGQTEREDSNEEFHGRHTDELQDSGGDMGPVRDRDTWNAEDATRVEVVKALSDLFRDTGRLLFPLPKEGEAYTIEFPADFAEINGITSYEQAYPIMFDVIAPRIMGKGVAGLKRAEFMKRVNIAFTGGTKPIIGIAGGLQGPERALVAILPGSAKAMPGMDGMTAMFGKAHNDQWRVSIQRPGAFNLKGHHDIVDATGNVVTYKGSAHLGAKGDVVKVTGKVQKHDEYKGTKQTVIERPKVAA